MDSNKTAVIIAIILTISLCCISFYAGRKTVSNNIKEVHDTVTVVNTIYDTTVIEKPVPRYVRIVDTLKFPVPGKTDTLYLPRTEKVYQDSTYYAVVSGVEPSLDTIKVRNKTVYVDRVINNTIKVPVYQKTHWGIGVSAGYGLNLDISQSVVMLKVSPQITLGITYNIFSW